MKTIRINNRDEFILGILILQTIPSLGPVRIRRIVQHLGSPLEIFHRVDKGEWIPGFSKDTLPQIVKQADFSGAEKILDKIRRSDMECVILWEDQYPASLRNIPDAPPLLYVKGDLSVLHRQSMVIVGTRHPSPYGVAVTQKFARELSENHIPIISGLARGIDTIAHKAALEHGNQTVAVLASGLDVIYPPENRSLAEKIISHGALVSEFPPGVRPEPSYFTRRNRIISGLAEGTIVIEAGEGSGALITANYALEQGREVFAVPGEITNPKARGTLKLIQEGAKCLIEIEDIFAELPHLSRKSGSRQEELPLLTEEQQMVLEHLSYKPLHIDMLQIRTGLSMARLNDILFELEIQGIVQQTAGRMYIKCC